MTRYLNLSGDSSVAAYELSPGAIVVQFTNGSTRNYRYTAASTGGAHHIDAMHRLASQGRGLGSYIQQHVRDGYESKW
jgi:hypothetical protein